MNYNMDDVQFTTMMGWSHLSDLKMRLKYIGKNVSISDKAVFYAPETLEIGDNSRIDDFVIITAPTKIGRYVHIACYASIVGHGQVTLEDYSAISGRTSIYSSSDPYDGSCMTNPCIPEPFRITYSLPVVIGKHTVVGAGCTILPGVTLGSNCAVGAMSLINKSFLPNKIIVGIPAKEVKDRSSHIYEVEKLFDEQNNKENTNS